MKIVTAEQMRNIERRCESCGLPAGVLMENAGKAFAEEVTRILGDGRWTRYVVLAGPGNNGGDGLVAARYLADWGADIEIFLFGRIRENDINMELVRERDIPCVQATGEAELDILGQSLAAADVVIDALFGTGSNRPLEGVYRRALEMAGTVAGDRPGLRIFALDLPSGMNADTGAVDEACLYADDTITLGFPKTGLYNFPGAERAGRVTVADIGIPDRIAEDTGLELNTAERVRSLLPRRPAGANKGTFGRVLAVAGSVNYAGAAFLACSGAIRSGAGLVTLASTGFVQAAVAAKLAEATYLPLPEEDGSITTQSVEIISNEIKKYDVLLAGCGLGQTTPTVESVRALLLDNDSLPQAVIDAGALNILAGVPEWWRQMRGNVILTPHPGEMARLTGLTVEEVQKARLKTAGEAAVKWNKTVVLKGAFTVIATPDGSAVLNPAANPGLATAGTGDVLAGVIAGLAAQGLEPADAASCGVYLHAAAGETVRERLGDTGMIASDLLPVLPAEIKKLKEKNTG